MWYRSVSLIVFFLLVLSSVVVAAASAAHGQERRERVSSADDSVLHVAWSLQEPYQFIDDRRELSGIDVTIMREAADRAGMTVVFRQMAWSSALDGLTDGRVDAVLAAFETPWRNEIGQFSDPIRTSEEALFMRREDIDDLSVSAPEGLLDRLAGSGHRIAVIEDYDLGPAFEAFRARVQNQGVIRPATDLRQAMAMFSVGVVDGFIIDRHVGNAAVSEAGWRDVAAHPAPVYSAEAGVLFSKNSVGQPTVIAFDRALADLRQDGAIDRIHDRFVLPIMIDMALAGPWFGAILTVGMIAFSISAVVLARTGGYGLYGAFVLAALPALGGGVLRDLVILREPYIFDYPVYIFIVLATLGIALLLNRLLDAMRGRSLLLFDVVNWLLRMRRRISPAFVMAIFDAAGIAAYTVVAVTIAVEFGRDPLWLWGPVLAVITATGGAIVRDMIRSDGENAILRGSFYGETVILWSLVLCLFLGTYGHAADPTLLFWALMTTMAGIFLTRLAVVYRDWQPPRY
ncbi:transporter substrate-binding domain-containing protein [Fodinicurvata sp. EGI_FJ10296]|uniref:transporter substrate-binding domain-containing protein n=1 Tax=Fodinicurvata sp. EGI_FJ10296 TaxID=3231908 RepID=UPI0034530DA6